MTESKLKESEEMLRKMKNIWPQYDIDGMRNIWILKPGDKSKGVGQYNYIKLKCEFPGSCMRKTKKKHQFYLNRYRVLQQDKRSQ